MTEKTHIYFDNGETAEIARTYDLPAQYLATWRSLTHRSFRQYRGETHADAMRWISEQNTNRDKL
jgi:hypothetical protein